MTEARTLLQISGADLAPAKVSESCLLLIDFQNEYRSGPIALPNADAAIENAASLLAAARAQGAPVIHVAHKGRVGGLFDPAAERGRIVSRLAPAPGESIVEKGLPNAFAGTDLHDRIAATGRINLVLAGFMTHMCVSSTARAALDFGYRVTIDSNSCATRDLPDGCGGIVAAALLNEVALVELSDRFALISRTIGALE